MASERELRNRMRQLEQQLAQQESQQANLRRQIEAQTQQQIADMQRRTEETFRRRMNETAEEYARRVRQFQEEILRRNEQQLRQLRQESEELNRRTRQTLKELEQCNKELREELKKLRDDASRQTAEGRRIAAEACQRAEAARTTAAQTPHDFFCPQEFEIISEHIADIEPLIKQGMYQAAISDASCIALEFELLRTKVNQAFSEWLQAFEDYRRIVRNLYAQVQAFEERQLQTTAGTFRMNPRELNFWSCGAYAPMVDTIKKAYEKFCTMNQQQVLEHLRATAGTNRRAVYDMVTQSRKWQDQLTAIMNCITCERVFSDERVTTADDISEMMEDFNGTEEVNSFQPPAAQVAQESWYAAPADENPLNSRDLHILLGEGNRIKIRFVPRRENGLAVANVMFLSVDMYSATDATTERLIAADTRSSVEALLKEKKLNIPIQFIPKASDPDRTICAQERLISPSPSTSAQIRYLERKYQ